MNFFPVTVTAVNDSGTTVQIASDVTVTVPVKPGHLAIGDRATLGIRPEHLQVDASHATLSGEVLVVERLGGETLLHVKIAGGEMLTVKTHGDDSSRVHDRIFIHIHGDLCHLFDQQGEAIAKAHRHPLTFNEPHEQQYHDRISH